MKALIMAAGYGTRLDPLTLAVPKPMVPIVNKPTMQHNIELLRRNGIKQIITNIHYHPEQLKNYFADGEKFGVHLHYSYEETLLGTAGGVRRMAKIGGVKETFLVLSSDALTDINLRKMLEYHKKKKALATIALMPVAEPSEFGVVVTDAEHRVTAFQEKPKKEEALSDLVNTGIYIFEPEILQMIPDEQFHDFGKELFPQMVKKGVEMFGYKMVEYWSDVGGLAPYIQANYDAMQGNVRVLIPGKKVASHTWIGKNCEIDPSAKFEGDVIIGDRCQVKAGAVLKNVVLGDRSVVGHGTVLTDSIIWSDTFIGPNGRIASSVVGNWCHVGKETVVEPGSILSNRCIIRAGAILAPGCRLKPNEIL